MMALVEDKVVYPTVIALSACLCQELAAAGGPEVCYCGPITGDVVMDYCGGTCNGGGCGGQAWVRFVDIYPSSTFPGLDNALANCKAPFAYSLEVGVARCAPTGESGPSGYEPPTLAENVEAIRLQLSDVAALRRAIQCCFGQGDLDYVMGAYAQAGVNGGGCVGGSFTVVVWEKF